MLDLNRSFVIAEAGTCHASASSPTQRLPLALKYVTAAADAGASAIKFQMFNTPIKDDMFCWIEGDEERLQRWDDSVLSLEDWKEIKATAEDFDLVFLASAFQHSTVEWFNELGVEATKVASRAASAFPYGSAPEPFLISNGMGWRPPLTFPFKHRMLQCEANYPSTARWVSYTPVVSPMRDSGFSDHSGTPWRAIDALAHGCKLVEVHFYIDPSDAGPDQLASLDLAQLELVCEARDEFAEI